MNYKLTITKRADELIDQIIYYLINQLNNPLAAVGLIEALELIYGNLEINPKMYAYLDEPFLNYRGYRKAVIPHFDYVIIFRIDEAAMCVYIVGFFHDLECYMNKLE